MPSALLLAQHAQCRLSCHIPQQGTGTRPARRPASRGGSLRSSMAGHVILKFCPGQVSRASTAGSRVSSPTHHSLEHRAQVAAGGEVGDDKQLARLHPGLAVAAEAGVLQGGQHPAGRHRALLGQLHTAFSCRACGRRSSATQVLTPDLTCFQFVCSKGRSHLTSFTMSPYSRGSTASMGTCFRAYRPWSDSRCTSYLRPAGAGGSSGQLVPSRAPARALPVGSKGDSVVLWE